jgi:hypothetical protein
MLSMVPDCLALRESFLPSKGGPNPGPRQIPSNICIWFDIE